MPWRPPSCTCEGGNSIPYWLPWLLSCALRLLFFFRILLTARKRAKRRIGIPRPRPTPRPIAREREFLLREGSLVGTRGGAGKLVFWGPESLVDEEATNRVGVVKDVFSIEVLVEVTETELVLTVEELDELLKIRRGWVLVAVVVLMVVDLEETTPVVEEKDVVLSGPDAESVMSMFDELKAVSWESAGESNTVR